MERRFAGVFVTCGFNAMRGGKLNGRPEFFRTRDARAALPQNCSTENVMLKGESENGTRVPKLLHQSATLSSTFFQGRSDQVLDPSWMLPVTRAAEEAAEKVFS